MTTNLPNAHINDSVTFQATVYDSDGVTLLTPLSCTCQIFDADTNTEVLAPASGAQGLGFARYVWAGTGTAGNYEAVLTVTIAAGNIQTEHFRVAVLGKPPAFTNDLTSAIGQMRAMLGDDLEGDGVNPNGSNLADAILQFFLDTEGGEVMRAVALACEALSLRWAKIASVTIGPRSEQLAEVSKQWAARAKMMRAQYGGAASGFAIEMGRADGYSDAANVISEWAEVGE